MLIGKYHNNFVCTHRHKQAVCTGFNRESFNFYVMFKTNGCVFVSSGTPGRSVFIGDKIAGSESISDYITIPPYLSFAFVYIRAAVIDCNAGNTHLFADHCFWISTGWRQIHLSKSILYKSQ